MRLLTIALTSLLIAAGCASAPSMLTPPPAQVNEFKFYQYPASVAESHVSVNLNDEKTITYIQNFGGGGVGVGLLLGPVGVLANVKMIEANTEEDKEMLYGKLPIDIYKTFTEVSANANLTEQAQAQSKISPYLLVVRDEDEVLRMATVMTVELETEGSKPWSGMYLYELDRTYAKADIAAGLNAMQQEELQTLIEEGFSQAIQLYDADRQNQMVSGSLVEFESNLITPRIAIAQRGEVIQKQAGRTLLRGVNAIYSFPADSFKITRYLKKKKA